MHVLDGQSELTLLCEPHSGSTAHPLRSALQLAQQVVRHDDKLVAAGLHLKVQAVSVDINHGCRHTAHMLCQAPGTFDTG